MQTIELSSASIALSDTTHAVPKFAKVDAASNGNNTLVAAVTGKKIRVLAGFFDMSGTLVTMTFQSGAGGTALTGAIGIAQSTTFTMPFCPVGHFETAAGALLNLSLSGAQQVSGYLVYIEV